jgi:hypothetical protein
MTKARLYPGAGKDWRRKVTTRCVHGHDYTPANTYVCPDGTRQCRACGREAVRRYQERKSG